MLTLEPLAETQARWPANSSVIADFVTHQTRRNLQPNTIATRRWLLQSIAAYTHKHLYEVTRDDMEAWLDGQPGSNGQGLMPATRAQYVTSFRMFYGWLLDEELILRDPTRKLAYPKVPVGIPRPVDDAVLTVAIKKAYEDDPRLFAMMTLMYLCGLRCVEVERLTVEDIDFGRGRIKIHGKGARERYVPMNEQVRAALMACDIHKRTKGPAFLRRGNYGAGVLGLSRRTISSYVSKALPPGVTAHQLRHWFGTFFYQACKDIRLTGDTMGHTNLNTTKRYTQVDVEKAAEVTANLGVAFK